MRLHVLVGAATVLSTACVGRSAPEAPAASGARSNATVFTDTALFRARCQEADKLTSLTPIPHQCTPREQRSDPVIFPMPPAPPPTTP